MATNSEKLKIVLAAHDKQFQQTMDRVMKKVGKLEQKTWYANNRMQKSYTKTGKVAKKGFTVMKAAMASMIASFSTISIGGMLGRLQDMVKQLDNIGKTADQLQVTTDMLQGLRHAGVSFGIATGEMDKGLKRLSEAMGDADKGLMTYKRHFDALGISVRDAAGKMRSADDVLFEMADKIHEVDDSATILRDTLGRAGFKFRTLFAGGTQGMQEAVDLVKIQGAVISEEAIRAGEALEDEYERLKAIRKAAEAESGIGWAPVGNWWEKQKLAIVRDLSVVQAMMGNLENEQSGVLNQAAIRLREGIKEYEDLLSEYEKGDRGFLDKLFKDEFRLESGLKQRREMLKEITDELDRRGVDTSMPVIDIEAEQVSAAEQYIRKLNDVYHDRINLIGMTAIEQEIYNAKKRSGIELTKQEEAEIARLITRSLTEIETIKNRNKRKEESAAIRKKEVSSYQDLVGTLTQEIHLMGLSQDKQTEYNQLKRLGQNLTESEIGLIVQLNQRKKELVDSQEHMNEVQEKANEIIRSNTTWQEELAEQTKLVDDAYKHGLISIQQYSSEISRLTETLDPAIQKMKAQAESFRSSMESTFEDTFTRLVESAATGSESIERIVKDMVSSIIRETLRLSIIRPISQALAGGLSGFIGGSFGGLGLSGAQHGGLHRPGPLLVGESGPELIYPRVPVDVKTAGQTKQTKSGGVTINQNLNFSLGVSETVKSEIYGMMPQIAEVTKTSVVNAQRRGQL